MLTPILLIIALVLTILPLLPSPFIPLFTIRPIGSPLPKPSSAIPETATSAVPTIPTITGIPALGSIPPIYNIVEPTSTDIPQRDALRAYLVPGAGAPLIRPDLPPTLWMGEKGPTIHVGALRVCSKVTQGTGEVCERLSAYFPGLENAVMPPSLSSVMSSYPKSSPGPILLVISASFQILAILCFLLDLIPWSRFAHCIRYRQTTGFRKAYPTSDSESALGLVRDLPSFEERESKRPWASTFFWTLACELGLGGVGVVLSTVSEAAGRWDDGLAKEVGMDLRFEAGCYLIGSMPLVLFLAGMIGIIPFVQDILKKYHNPAPSPSSRSEPSLMARAEMGDIEIDVRPMKQGSRNKKAEKATAIGMDIDKCEEQLDKSVAKEEKTMRIWLEPENMAIGQAR